eukprot:1798905-Rhodomonas_salina.1
MRLERSFPSSPSSSASRSSCALADSFWLARRLIVAWSSIYCVSFRTAHMIMAGSLPLHPIVMFCCAQPLGTLPRHSLVASAVASSFDGFEAALPAPCVLVPGSAHPSGSFEITGLTRRTGCRGMKGTGRLLGPDRNKCESVPSLLSPVSEHFRLLYSNIPRDAWRRGAES